MSDLKRHLHRHGFEVVQPTPRMVIYWWVRCLDEVFSYPKRPSLVPATVEIRRQPAEWAACIWPAQESNAPLHLTMHNEPLSRRGLITILLHEQVHAILAFEDRHGGEQHGERFLAYAGLVKERTGLPLRARYSRDDLQAVMRKSPQGQTNRRFNQRSLPT